MSFGQLSSAVASKYCIKQGGCAFNAKNNVNSQVTLLLREQLHIWYNQQPAALVMASIFISSCCAACRHHILLLYYAMWAQLARLQHLTQFRYYMYTPQHYRERVARSSLILLRHIYASVVASIFSIYHNARMHLPFLIQSEQELQLDFYLITSYSGR